MHVICIHATHQIQRKTFSFFIGPSDRFVKQKLVVIYPTEVRHKVSNPKKGLLHGDATVLPQPLAIDVTVANGEMSVTVNKNYFPKDKHASTAIINCSLLDDNDAADADLQEWQTVRRS